MLIVHQFWIDFLKISVYFLVLVLFLCVFINFNLSLLFHSIEKVNLKWKKIICVYLCAYARTSHQRPIWKSVSIILGWKFLWFLFFSVHKYKDHNDESNVKKNDHDHYVATITTKHQAIFILFGWNCTLRISIPNVRFNRKWKRKYKMYIEAMEIFLDIRNERGKDLLAIEVTFDK